MHIAFAQRKKGSKRKCTNTKEEQKGNRESTVLNVINQGKLLKHIRGSLSIPMIEMHLFPEVLASESGILFKRLCPSGIYLVVNTDRTVLMCRIRQHRSSMLRTGVTQGKSTALTTRSQFGHLDRAFHQK